MHVPDAHSFPLPSLSLGLAGPGEEVRDSAEAAEQADKDEDEARHDSEGAEDEDEGDELGEVAREDVGFTGDGRVEGRALTAEGHDDVGEGVEPGPVEKGGKKVCERKWVECAC